MLHSPPSWEHMMADFGTDPIKSQSDLMRFETEMSLEARLPEQSILDVFINSAARSPDATAMTMLMTGAPDETARQVSYRDLLGQIRRAANLFAQIGGTAPGVAFMLPALVETHVTLWGAETVGYAVPINFLLQPESIVELLRAAEVKILVAFGPHPQLDIWEKALVIQAQMPELQLVRLSPPGAAADDGIIDFATAMAAQPDDHLTFGAARSGDDLAAYFHTGGTTGLPKLVAHTHRSQLVAAFGGAVMCGYTPDDVLTATFPLFHVAGTIVAGLSGFMAGIEASLKLGADTIINTDADNQYDASCIPDLVAPIVEGKAEIVVGARPINDTPHFSGIKKFLQRLGSFAVRVASNTSIPDAPSGFRAIHREAAMRMFVFSEYTYTLETIIQAGRKNMRITSVPVRTNEDLRPSRLVKSIASYVQRSLVTILRVFITYKPLRACFTVGSVFALGAAVLGLRFLWAFMTGDGAGKVQSLILLSVLAMASFVSFAVGVIAELQAANRNLLEDIRLRLLRAELASEETRSQRARFDQVRQELAETDPAQRPAGLQSRAG